MKVGIMSMQRIENYGSFLQAYSLRQMLEELGHEVDFIDYVIEPCIVKVPKSPVPPKRSVWYRAVRRIYYLLLDAIRTFDGEKKAEQRLEASRLRNCYADYVQQLGVTAERTENIPVDVLVIGSDEVFNCLQTNPAVGYSKQLFGESVNAGKVITYAACAGFTTVEGLDRYGILDEVSTMLRRNFTHLSVRDQNTFELVESLTGIKPEIHLDPVLISDFSTQIDEKNDLTDYVVVYSYEERMSNRIDERDAIQSFAHERGLKTVSIGNYQTWTDLHIPAAPFELLGYLKNAEYIITDTFHGTVFSIILEKKFATLVRESNAQKLGSLLSQFGLADRQVNQLSELKRVITADIDYKRANAIRKRGREEALAYLKSAIAN
ncbi:MAG: polysaccharide pyruvyl transferase family protein [Lachnospiraceae bacterium]